MKDDWFEWDDRKAATNAARHGVSFEVARLAFEDPHVVGRVDTREDYGEERYVLLGMPNSRLLHVAYALRGERFESYRPDLRSRANGEGIMKATARRKVFARLEAATTEARHAADPDARPMTDEEWAAAPPVPQVWLTRHRLRLSQEEFAAQFHIPLGTLRDWEQRRKEPDAAAKAYLRVIALAPDVVRKALAARPQRRNRRAQ